MSAVVVYFEFDRGGRGVCVLVALSAGAALATVA